MATKSQEVEVLRGGIQANAPSKGVFALNMLYANNAWQVREGFGQVTQFDTMMATPRSLGFPGGDVAVRGLTKHLGSHLIKTNFGNLQMLSVFLAEVNVAVVDTAGPRLPPASLPWRLASMMRCRRPWAGGILTAWLRQALTT